MKTLHIIIKRKYFDQILSGKKTKEYRLVKEYWVKKIVGKNYNTITFQAGYSKNSPKMIVEYLGFDIVNLKHEFFGNDTVVVFSLNLGKIIQHAH